MPTQVVVQRPSDADQDHGRSYNPAGFPDITTGPNVVSDYSLTMERPVIAETAYVHPQASVIGYVTLGERVLVAPQASVRGDEGKNILVGDETSVQDGVVIHALSTEEKGVSKMEHRVVVNGQEYAVYIGERVTLAPQSQVHGPSVVADDAYIGMQALVFKARIGAGCVLEPRAAAIGVNIREGHYVPAGVVVTSQEQADSLPAITPGYAYKDAGAQAVKVNTQLAEGYRNLYPAGYQPSAAPEAAAGH
ncbi:carbonic anhydrase [bacterium]|nr:carbonic anhydrase [bacterium]